LMMFGATERTTHAGLNDNTIAAHGDIVARLMPRSRFVFIVRDPRELAVSLWHHKMRTEPDFARDDPPLAVTLRFVAKSWPEHIARMESFRASWGDRCHLVHYEALRGPSRDEALAELLGFLGAPAPRDVLQAMWAATDF